MENLTQGDGRTRGDCGYLKCQVFLLFNVLQNLHVSILLFDYTPKLVLEWKGVRVKSISM